MVCNFTCYGNKNTLCIKDINFIELLTFDKIGRFILFLFLFKIFFYLSFFYNNFSLFSIFRSESTQQRSRRLPLNSIDSEDGIGMGDDDMEALLPNNRGLSGDDLSHVSIDQIFNSKCI